MRSASLYGYQIAMESGVFIRDRRLSQREGLVLYLSEQQREGWGEAAPLPGFSSESLEQVTPALITMVQQWLQGETPTESGLPSVDFAMSCALAELQGELPEQGNYAAAPLCYGDPDELFERLQQIPGEKIAKVKVGLYEAVRDGLVVNTLLEALPELQLRLDANRSWSAQKADGFAKYVQPHLRSRIQFIEEPCRTREESVAFSRQHGIAIAWDESVREEGFCVEAQPGVRAIIIKPMLIGSLPLCRRLIAQAHKLGLLTVISSSLESSLGLNQLARIAQELTPEGVPGLDTLALMQQQVIRPWPGSDLPLLTESELQLLWQS
ncbi:MAG: o-succinylbenzoate synthase [Enterobacteriaceae bacterium]